VGALLAWRQSLRFLHKLYVPHGVSSVAPKPKARFPLLGLLISRIAPTSTCNPAPRETEQYAHPLEVVPLVLCHLLRTHISRPGSPPAPCSPSLTRARAFSYGLNAKAHWRASLLRVQCSFLFGHS
jgi:hypothetical protein